MPACLLRLAGKPLPQATADCSETYAAHSCLSTTESRRRRESRGAIRRECDARHDDEDDGEEEDQDEVPAALTPVDKVPTRVDLREARLPPEL